MTIADAPQVATAPVRARRPARQIRAARDTATVDRMRRPVAGVETLRQIPLFASLGPADLERVRVATVVRPYRRGDIIALPGERNAPLRIVRTGAVKLFATSSEGREQVLRLVSTGQMFGMVAALDGKPSAAAAAVVEASEIYAIRGAEVRRLVEEHPTVARAAVQALAAAVREMVGLAEELSLHHVTQRVARLLLDQEERTCERCRAHRLTQQEMAAVVGTAREVVGRSLRDLQLAGIVTTQRGRVVVLDHERLRQLAG